MSRTPSLTLLAFLPLAACALGQPMRPGELPAEWDPGGRKRRESRSEGTEK